MSSNLYLNKNNEIKKIEYDKLNTIILHSQNTNDIEIVEFKKEFLKPISKDSCIKDCLNKLELKIITIKNDIYILKDKNNKFLSLTKNEIYSITQELLLVEKKKKDRKFKRIDSFKISPKLDYTIEDGENNFDKLINNYHKNLRKSKTRAIKAFYDYARNYKWEYFCTFTFKNEMERNDKEQVKNLYQSFIKKLQKQDKNVKAIAVVEKHKNGGYHLHALIKDCKLQLTLAKNNNKNSKDYGKILTTQDGQYIFNLDLWENGFSTVVIIPEDDNNNKVVNYLTKYLTKDNISGYCQKSFFKTRNLEKREKQLLLSDNINLFSPYRYNVKLYKSNDKMNIYKKND